MTVPYTGDAWTKAWITKSLMEAMGLTVTDDQLKGIWQRYQQRMAGPSGTVEPKAERKAWAWSLKEDGLEVTQEELPKRKLSFREWLDGGMKGECEWPKRITG